jgi:hypothetical protein
MGLIVLTQAAYALVLVTGPRSPLVYRSLTLGGTGSS